MRLAASTPLARWVAKGAALSLIAALVGLVFAVAGTAGPGARALGLGLALDAQWDPGAGQFGARGPLLATLASSVAALAVALPGALLVALYATDFAPPRLRRGVSTLLDLLAALPSVVYGLWAAAVLAPVARAAGIGASVAGVGSASLVLALMALPTISAVTRDVIAAVPAELREAGLALGGTPWEVLRHVVLPHARRGLVAAAMLGLSRALGETIAVSMVLGSFSGAPPTAAGILGAEAARPTSPQHAAALAELTLTLLVAAIALNLSAHGVVRRYLRRPAAGLSTGPSEGELGGAP